MVSDNIWKLPTVVKRFLSYREAIPLAQEQISIMMSILQMREQPVEKFLDLGCGDGILGAAILGEYPPSYGVLIDFSEPMLKQARKQLAEFVDQLAFVNLDYGASGWVDMVQDKGPFDAVVSGYSIHHQPDARKRGIYEDIFSLLKPDGWFINIEHIAPAAPLVTDLFNNLIVEGYYAIEQRQSGTRTREEMANIYMNRPDKEANRLLPVDIQCNWLRELGYEEVDCYFRIYELAVLAGRRPNRQS